MKLLSLFTLGLLFTLFSCNNDDNSSPIIVLEDLEVTIDENPTLGQVLGVIQSNTSSTLTYSITSQTPAGALTINASTGELTVSDETLFDYEAVTSITATVDSPEASNSAMVTINLNNVDELSAEDLTINMDENPADDDYIGAVIASGDGTLTYSITAQSHPGAIVVVASTGQLYVDDSTFFDYETNPVLTATILVDNTISSEAIIATVNLNNVNELNVNDLTVTMDENPVNGTFVGNVIASGDGTLSYNISSQIPAGALSINSSTGELIVADATVFDYETNPVITATVTVDNTVSTVDAMININLNDLNEIGEYKYGGVIFSINAAGDQGLVCAITDQIYSADWGCEGTLISGTSTAFGTGQANTTAIVSGCTSIEIAADVADEAIINSYNDWYLPSRDELSEIYDKRAIISATATANGGVAFNTSGTAIRYWSSSEASATTAWAKYFFSGNDVAITKSSSSFCRVRAIRTWTDF